MADLTMRDAAKIERDRQVQFSQFGSRLRLRIYDSKGALLREVKTFWNRYRKTTRENVVYYSFKIADFKEAFEEDLVKAGDHGKLGVYTGDEEPQYNVNRVDGWEVGESKVWTITTDSINSTKASSFFQRP
jgi:hypothetical protein